MKVYMLYSYDYEDYEVLGIFDSFEVAEQVRLSTGHKQCKTQEMEIQTQPILLRVYLSVNHTVVKNTGEEFWRAYSNQPTSYCDGVDINVGKVDYITHDLEYHNNKYFQEYWTVTAYSMESGIKLLREALGDKYSEDIDTQLREDML